MRSEPARVGVRTYDGYTLNSVNLTDALSKNYTDIKEVLESLENTPVDRLSLLSKDSIFSSAPILSDMKAYVNIDEEEIQQACDKLHNHFEKPSTANGFIKAMCSCVVPEKFCLGVGDH